MTCKSTIISKNKCDLLSIKHWFLYSFRNPCYTRLTMIDLNSSKFYRNSLQLKRCNSWWVIRLKCNWCKENWRFSIWMREISSPRQKRNSRKKSSRKKLEMRKSFKYRKTGMTIKVTEFNMLKVKRLKLIIYWIFCFRV